MRMGMGGVEGAAAVIGAKPVGGGRIVLHRDADAQPEVGTCGGCADNGPFAHTKALLSHTCASASLQ